MAYFGNVPIQSTYLTDYFSGNGSTVAFTLSRAPIAASSVIITISGVKQAASTYGVSGTTLTFSEAPPTGTNNIEVLHLGIAPETVTLPSYRTVTEFTATAGQATFSPASYTAGYIDVYRNGVKLGADDFTATNGTTVVLDNACTEGDLVRFESFLITSFNNAIPAVAGAVTNEYLGGLSTITTSGANTITVPNETGTMLTSASSFAQTNGSCFHAYNSLSNYTVFSNSTETKVVLNATVFDANNDFNTSTYRFQPSIAGYYHLTASAEATWTTTQYSRFDVALWKNYGVGNNGYRTVRNVTTTTYDYGGILVSGLFYLNGSTDYVEMYVYSSGGSGPAYVHSDQYETHMSGFLVRAA